MNHNGEYAMGKKSYTKTLNKFSDLTPAELNQELLEEALLERRIKSKCRISQMAPFRLSSSIFMSNILVTLTDQTLK